MLENVVSLLKDKASTQFQFAEESIILLEQLLALNISNVEVSDELAYVYFRNIKLNVPFNKLAEAKRLYENDIKAYLYETYNTIFRLISELVLGSVGKNPMELSDSTPIKLTVPKKYLNFIQKLKGTDYKFILTDTEIGLIDGIFQTIKVENMYTLRKYYSSWTDRNIKETNTEVVLSREDVQMFRSFLFQCGGTSGGNFKKIDSSLQRRPDQKTESTRIKSLLILLYSTVLSNDYYSVLESMEEYRGKIEFNSVCDLLFSELKRRHKYSQYSSFINGYVDIPVDAALCINPKIQYPCLRDIDYWKSHSQSSYSTGREFLNTVWSLITNVSSSSDIRQCDEAICSSDKKAVRLRVGLEG